MQGLKMNIQKITALVLSAMSIACAHAQSSDEAGAYIQVGTSNLNLDYNNGQYNYNLGSTNPVYLGFDFNKNLGIEFMHASASTSDYSTTLTFNAFYVKPKLPINDTFEVFARVGSNNTTLSTAYGSVSKASPSFGMGLTTYVTEDKKNYIIVDVNQWYSQNGWRLTGAGVSLGHKF